MTKKTLGYVELEWPCPACGTRNPGKTKTCQNCGAAMPENVEFELPQQQEISTNASPTEGADIHCPYCGTRNVASAETCTQCGGDLVKGTRRESGRVVGSYDGTEAPPQTCPQCGAENPGAATKCSQCGGVLGEPQEAAPTPAPEAKRKGCSPLIGLAALILVALVFWLMGRGGNEETVGVVTDVRWAYSIAIDELRPASYSDWQDLVPSGAQVIRCTNRVRSVSQEPVENATEVCGTPYVVDTGTGDGEVMQDCEYHVTDAWCEYTVLQWQSGVTEATEQGSGYSPYWPALNLSSSQVSGERSESYAVVLLADDAEYTYHPESLEEYRDFSYGSRWVLTTNAWGGITSIRSDD